MRGFTRMGLIPPLLSGRKGRGKKATKKKESDLLKDAMAAHTGQAGRQRRQKGRWSTRPKTPDASHRIAPANYLAMC